MLFFTLLALQAAATAIGGVYLWRRCERLREEVRGLRALLGLSPYAPPTGQRALPHAQAAPVDSLTKEGWIGFLIAIVAAAPALGLAFGAHAAVSATLGLCVAAGLLTASLRLELQGAAWPGVLAAAAWALVGLAFAEGALAFSAALGIAGVVSVAHAALRRSPAGFAGAVAMAAAALALGAHAGMISAAGAAFAAIVLSAAIAGALKLDLEAMHVAAFGASLVGLLVLSGQDNAALWFTPAAAMTGAVFFAIAVVRVPQLGERGVTLAGAGVLAPLMATAALHVSQHGLADGLSAAAAFVALALAFGWLLSASAARNHSYAALRLTLWVFASAIFIALVAAASVAAYAPLAAALTALTALLILVLDRFHNTRILRFFACAAAGATLIFALLSIRHVFAEQSAWPGYAVLALGVAAPAAILGVSALLAQRAARASTSAALEACAILLGVGALSSGLRLIAAQGATLLHPVSFAEAGVHVTLWLGSALILRRRARKGARHVRIVAAHVLTYLSLTCALISSVLWLTPFWTGKAAQFPLLLRDTFGFALPAAGFIAHWAFWRWRGIAHMARICFAAGTASAAAFAAAEISRMDSSPHGLASIAITLLLFAGAALLNFWPAILRRRTPPERDRARPIPATRKAA
jgi:hypothetical protein